jgi:thiamine-phosphate pyrophosphorylase
LLLYYITDRTQFRGDEPERRERLLQKISEAAHAGVDYVQLREKDLSSRDLELLASKVVERARATCSSTRLLINSRTDIALATRADGVHLRSNDISPQEVRRIWRKAGAVTPPAIAVSCHTEAEVISAKQSGADFVVFGPVFEKGDELVAGVEALRSACRHNIPVFALGGITLANARSCMDAGAVGIAGIRLFQEDEVRRLVAALRR